MDMDMDGKNIFFIFKRLFTVLCKSFIGRWEKCLKQMKVIEIFTFLQKRIRGTEKGLEKGHRKF